MSQQKSTFVAKQVQTSEKALSEGLLGPQPAISARATHSRTLVSATNRPRLEAREAVYGPLIRSCTAR